MPPKKSSIVLNVEQFIRDIEYRPAIWNRNFHCNKVFLEQMWDELSSEHKLPKVVLKAKWKGLRDNFRVEYKRIPRAENGYFLVEPAAFESKWTHYYALLFLNEHMRHRMPKNNATEDRRQSNLFGGQQIHDSERTIVEPDLSNGLVRRLNESDEELDEEDDVDEEEEEDDDEEDDTGRVSSLQQRQTTLTPPAAHANSYHGNLSSNVIKTEDARALLKMSVASGIFSVLDDETVNSNSNSEVEREAHDLSKKTIIANNSESKVTTTVTSNRMERKSPTFSRVGTLSNYVSGHSIPIQKSPTSVNSTTSSRSALQTLSVTNVTAHIGATSLTSAISAPALNNTTQPIKVVSVTNAIASQQHKIRSVSPPPLYNKAHHPLATAVSTKERSNSEDYSLSVASNCHIHHAGGGGGISNIATGTANGIPSVAKNNVHFNFTKNSYANGLIPALKLKRPRLSEDSQFNGSSTMDTTTASNGSTTASVAHSPLQNIITTNTPSNGLLSAVPDDDDYHYLLSLHPFMKLMSSAQKLRIRTKFQKLLFKELYKEDREESK